jgi:hypothetical protein
MRIDQFSRGQRARQHIHPEVPPRKVFLERDFGAALNLEIAVASADRALAPGQGDVYRLAINSELDHRKRGTHKVNAADRAETRDQLVEGKPDDDVIGICGRKLDAVDPSADLVANAAADGEKRSARQDGSQTPVQREGFHGELPRETDSSSGP